MSGVADPLVSIIVPIFNSEQWLGRCLESLDKQTYDRCEFVLVDDGSSDGSGVIIDEFSRGHTNCRVLHKTNGGVSSARNAGIVMAAGEYILFVDADDWIDHFAVQELVDIVRSKKADVVIAPFFEDSLDGTTVIHQAVTDRNCDLSLGPMANGIALYAFSFFFKRERFDGLLFDEKIELGEDMDFCYRLYLNASVISIADEPFYHYQVDVVESATHNISVTKRMESNRVRYEIAKNEICRGIPQPAFNRFIQDSFGLLCAIAKDEGYSANFKTVMARVAIVAEGLDEFNMKNKLLVMILLKFPRLFAACAMMLPLDSLKRAYLRRSR